MAAATCASGSRRCTCSAADPAGIRGLSAREALRAIRERRALFVSRGDLSGTHLMERDLWKGLGGALPERETWYVQAGQGMMATLALAAEKGGYTLTDRGTWLAYENLRKGDSSLEPLVEGDPALFNLYSVIAVNPLRCGAARLDLALEFIDWIAGPEGRKLIREFTLGGKPLFTVAAE